MTERLVSDIVDRCLNVWLEGTYSAQYNAAALAINATTTEITCQFPPGEIGQGSFIAIGDELMLVKERDATNSRLIVVRAVRGTTATAHPVGTAIEVNPRFPRFLVRQAMSEEIDGWTDRLYQPKTFVADLASSATVIAVEATVEDLEVLGVIRVRRASLNFFDNRYRRTTGYDVQGNFGTEGATIMLAEDVGTTTTFNVTVACAFNTDAIDDFGDDADLIGDVGLTRGMCEIVELGAAYRLLTGRGSVRLFPEAQGQSRSADEVGAGDIPQFARSLLAMRDRAEAREVRRMYSRYGFGGE